MSLRASRARDASPVSHAHPAAPCSGTLRQSRLGCCLLLPRCLGGLMLFGRKGRAALLWEGCLWLCCCELVFLRAPFWWAAADEREVDSHHRWRARTCLNPATLVSVTWRSGRRSSRDILVRSWGVRATLTKALPRGAWGGDQWPTDGTLTEEETQELLKELTAVTLTRVLRKARSDADLQGFARRLQSRHISLTLNKHDLPRAASAQEAPVFLLQLYLQSEQQQRWWTDAASTPVNYYTVHQNTAADWIPHSRVIKLER